MFPLPGQRTTTRKEEKQIFGKIFLPNLAGTNHHDFSIGEIVMENRKKTPENHQSEADQDAGSGNKPDQAPICRNKNLIF